MTSFGMSSGAYRRFTLLTLHAIDQGPYRATASTVTMVTYGHQVISDDDAYLKLIEKVNVATLDSGAPGSAMVDLIPARWSFKKKIQSLPMH